uniref:Transmembrane protein n=1 Tax=Kalanchoe fedtschenkoi TaxID=63787 RepID=A0A7N0T6W7_KALFE
MKAIENQRQQQWWSRLSTSIERLSYRNATLILSLFNLLLFLLLVHDLFLSSSSSAHQFLSNSDQQQGRESEQIRLAMQPFRLIQALRDIELENENLHTALHEDPKQTAALDLSNRLKDIHSYNDASSLKALAEWRRRKMERARKRETERNVTSQD